MGNWALIAFYAVLFIVDVFCTGYFIKEYISYKKEEDNDFPEWFLVFAITIGIFVSLLQLYIIFSGLFI